METIEKTKIISGSLSEVINKLLMKSYDDENYFHLIMAILHVIRDSNIRVRDFKTTVKRIDDEFTVLFEYEKDQYLVFEYDLKDLKANSDFYMVAWQYLDSDLIKPLLTVS